MSMLIYLEKLINSVDGQVLHLSYASLQDLYGTQLAQKVVL